MRLIDADKLIRDMEENPPSYGDMDRVISAVNNAPTVGGWISVKDRLPEKNGEYLVSLCDGPYITSALYERGRQVSEWTDTIEEYLDYQVAHWMPLPEPPKEVEGDA